MMPEMKMRLGWKLIGFGYHRRGGLDYLQNDARNDNVYETGLAAMAGHPQGEGL
jgi:hypothetical protein